MTTAADLPPVPLPAPPQPAPAPQLHLTLVPPVTVPAQPGELADDADFDAALRLATPRLQRYANRRLQDPHESEEVVQEALLRAFQHRDDLQTTDDLMAWLTVVTGRLVIDRVRVRGRSTPVAELPPGGRTARDTAEVVVARDEARIALDALEAMPARQASVLWAREIEGLSYVEIAARFGISEPSVRSLLQRARQTLRKEYAHRGGTLPAVGLVALAPWLHGLRLAAKLRHVARRAGATTTVAATGLAIATVAPLWSHPAPAAPVPGAAHGFVVKAEARPERATSPAHTVKAAARPVAPTRTVVTARPAARPVVLNPTCTHAGSSGINCQGFNSTMLYVKVGTRSMGLGSNELPVECTALPGTPLTHCQPSSDGNK